MKKINLLLAASASLLLFGCNNKGGGIEIPSPKTQGIYILGEGYMGSNNSTLYYYELTTRTVTNRFAVANPDATLGDTANDMETYGSKLYVAVDASNKVLVLDAASGRILEEIPMGDADGRPREPRYLACAAGKVFVSLYSGEVARIDTASYDVDYVACNSLFRFNEGIVAVGKEKLCVANGRAEGGVYGNTVTVIDIPSFSVADAITVPLNPNRLAVTSSGDVYLTTWGDYLAVGAQLHKLDLTAKTYTTVPDVEVSRIAVYDRTLYGVNTVYGGAPDFPASASLVKVNLIDNTAIKMVDSKSGSDFNGVDVNPLNGYVYVMDANTNEVLRFDEKGSAVTPSIPNAGNRINTVAFFNKMIK